MSGSEEQPHEGAATPVHEGAATPVHELPMVFADVALITASEFTIHVQLGASLPDGNVLPGAVVSMSEPFARSLCAYLMAVLDGEVADPDEAEQPNSDSEHTPDPD